MDKTAVIRNTEAFVKDRLKGAEGGHDWFHVMRVWNTAKHIASEEEGDPFVVELGALLHDIADSKFHDGDEKLGPQLARKFLSEQGVTTAVIDHVENIIRHVSFKGGNFVQEFTSPELRIIQDADRLDAMGAIGVARCFNYGGFKNREIYNPDIKPDLNMTKETYRKSEAPSINHFYEKLLRLRERMHTETGKKLAADRHLYMEKFLEQFYAEWNGHR
jgi:uncharacterized protein